MSFGGLAMGVNVAYQGILSTISSTQKINAAVIRNYNGINIP
jgi:hypothetical protein